MNNLNRIIPKEGSPETVFSRLSEYINQVDKKWINKIKPASSKDLKKLKEICNIKNIGTEIPKTYFEYISNMGVFDGGLLLNMIYADYSIYDAIELNEDTLDDNDINFYKFYIGISEADVEYYLKFNIDGSYVITCDYDECHNISPYSNDFEKFLFLSAYLHNEEKYLSEKFDIYINFEKDNKNLNIDNILKSDTLLKYITENNFEKFWFSDDYNFVAYKKQISFILSKRDNIVGSIYGTDKLEIQKISRELHKIINDEIITKES